MSTTIVAVMISLLSQVLPLIGIHLGDTALQTTIQTLVAVATGLWIWYRRVSVGDIHVSGARK